LGAQAADAHQACLGRGRGEEQDREASALRWLCCEREGVEAERERGRQAGRQAGRRAGQGARGFRETRDKKKDVCNTGATGVCVAAPPSGSRGCRERGPRYVRSPRYVMRTCGYSATNSSGTADLVRKAYFWFGRSLGSAHAREIWQPLQRGVEGAGIARRRLYVRLQFDRAVAQSNGVPPSSLLCNKCTGPPSNAAALSSPHGTAHGSASCYAALPAVH
jgi:hypothetical protein